MGAFPNFYTYKQDIRPLGNGSVITYRYDRAAFTSDALGQIGQGEMCAWDATNQRVLRWNRSGANGDFIGVSRDAADGLEKLGNQPALQLKQLGVFTTGIHELVGTTGDTYSHGNPVFQSGTDTTKVTKTQAGGVQVGTIHNPLNLTLVGAIRVPVLIDEFTKTQV